MKVLFSFGKYCPNHFVLFFQAVLTCVARLHGRYWSEASACPETSFLRQTRGLEWIGMPEQGCQLNPKYFWLSVSYIVFP